MAKVDCTELLEQLGEYLDAEARADLCRAIEEHMDKCRDCRVVVDKTRKTILLYQADRSTPLPMAVTDRLHQVLARAYQAQGTDAPGGGAGASGAGD